jgi:hypothetical protein
MAQLSARISAARKPAARIPIPQAAAACTGFAAFSVSMFVGIASDNPSTTVMTRALLAMVAGFVGGFTLGLVCDWIVREEIARIDESLEADAAQDARAGRAGAEVDLDGLTGVDVIEEEPEPLASGGAGFDDRRVR